VLYQNIYIPSLENITTGMTNCVLSINPSLFEPHSKADKFPKDWWNARSVLAQFWQVNVNIHLLSTITHFFHNKYCCTSSGTRPICALVTEDQLCGAGCMCDTALARLSKQRGTLSGIPVAGKMDQRWWTLA